MAAAADAHTGSNAVLDAQYLDEDRSQDIAEDTGEHDHSHSHRRDTAQLGTQFHGDGSGD